MDQGSFPVSADYVCGTDIAHVLPRDDAAPALQADTDERLVELWLNGRAVATQAAYRADARALASHVGKPLRAITLADLQSFAGGLSHLKPASQARKIAAVKSLFAFGHRLGYLPLDTGAALLLPKLKDRLSERIITEAEAQRLMQLEPNARNHALLRLLYAGGLRISEACALGWRDLTPTKTGGIANVFGKGGKTRPVLIQPKLWRLLTALRGSAPQDAPVFRSGKGGSLDRSAVHRIVKAAVKRAGLRDEVSTHWLRHAHASHALDHGCAPHELQASLGHASLATTSRYVHVRPGTGSALFLPE